MLLTKWPARISSDIILQAHLAEELSQEVFTLGITKPKSICFTIFKPKSEVPYGYNSIQYAAVIFDSSDVLLEAVTLCNTKKPLVTLDVDL